MQICVIESPTNTQIKNCAMMAKSWHIKMKQKIAYNTNYLSSLRWKEYFDIRREDRLIQVLGVCGFYKKTYRRIISLRS